MLPTDRTGWIAVIDALGKLLAAERELTHEVKQTRAAKRLASSRIELLRHLQNVNRSNDLALMIETERVIVKGDLKHYANSKSMTGSLKTALNELSVIEMHLALVNNPAQYRIVDQAHTLPKNRKLGLPHDEACQALASHHARLDNLDKSRLDETEKDLIDARKAVIAHAAKLYRQRQADTLGIDPPEGA